MLTWWLPGCMKENKINHDQKISYAAVVFGTGAKIRNQYIHIIIIVT